MARTTLSNPTCAAAHYERLARLAHVQNMVAELIAERQAVARALFAEKAVQS
jgi:hypothetical protein